MYISSKQIIFYDKTGNVQDKFNYSIGSVQNPVKENKNYQNQFGYINLYRTRPGQDNGVGTKMQLWFNDSKQSKIGEMLATIHEPDPLPFEESGTGQTYFKYVDDKQKP